MGIVHNRLALRIYSGGFGTLSEYFLQNINKSLQVFLFRTILVLIIQQEPLFYFFYHTITFLENTLYSVRHCPLNKPKKRGGEFLYLLLSEELHGDAGHEHGDGVVLSQVEVHQLGQLLRELALHQLDAGLMWRKYWISWSNKIFIMAKCISKDIWCIILNT